MTMNYEFKPREVTVKRNLRNSSFLMQIFAKVMDSPRGVTADELEVRLGFRSSTISSALNAMRNRKMIVDSGERRSTRSGRQAIVYMRRKPKGR